MLSLLALPVLAAPASVADIPNPRPGWVADVAEVLDPEAEARINTRIDALEAELGVEIAVVAVADVVGEPKAFATDLLNTWGVGKADASNGLLLLLVVDRRRVEIEVGYGLEPVLTDGTVGALLDAAVVPHFKAGNLGKGLESGVEALDAAVRRKPEEARVGTLAPEPVPVRVAAPEPFPTEVLVGGLAVVGLVGAGVGASVAAGRRRRACPTCGKQMELLDEVADDAHLDAGQRKEEDVGSVDYEVRVCAEHQQVTIIPNAAWFSGKGKCVGCGYRTSSSSSRTITAATYDHGGEIEVRTTCAHCGHDDVSRRFTAKRTRPSTTSSRSSFGGGGGRSSSGGSRGGFGGGRSGGGGAGRSW